MPIAIPLSSQKRLLRMISARTDMIYATSAFYQFSATNDEDAKYHFYQSMVLAYCRPFTENYGIGSLLCEYPTYPDFTDADLNLRHQRMLDLRNKFLRHSSIEGTKVWLLAPDSTSPASGETAVGYGYAVAKLTFSDSRFVSWLHELVSALTTRLVADIAVVAKEIGSNYLKNGETFQLDTGAKPFEWNS